MKKTIICLLLITIFAALFTPVQAVAKSEPTTVAFDKLTELVIAGNTAYRRERNEIRALEISLNTMNRQFNEIHNQQFALEQMLAMPGYANTTAGAQTEATVAQLNVSATELDKNIQSLRTRINEAKDSLTKTAKRHTLPAQNMYISNYILLIDLEIAERDMKVLERDLENCKLRQARGLSTTSDVRTAERNIENQETLIESKQDAIESNLDTLARYLNLSQNIILAGLPEFDFDKITTRNKSEDMKAFIASASAPAERVSKDAIKAAFDNPTPENQHSASVAAQDLEKAKKDAEEDFPKAYDALLKAYNDYINSKSVADAQRDFDNLTSQHERGLTSKNMLLNAEQMLENIKSRYEQQKIQLWTILIDYELKLIY